MLGWSGYGWNWSHLGVRVQIMSESKADAKNEDRPVLFDLDQQMEQKGAESKCYHPQDNKYLMNLIILARHRRQVCYVYRSVCNNCMTIKHDNVERIVPKSEWNAWLRKYNYPSDSEYYSDNRRNSK
jgi:hypothetical protein